jgi:holo-[acyl-carrier protein] synthase
MLYTGIDLIEIVRIERAVARWGERFLRRVFTPAELSAYRGRLPSLAVRWTAKEATAKLLGVGMRGLGASERPADAVAWTEIEILGDTQGRPTLALYGRAAERARALGLGSLALSLSHTHEHAIASVVALAEPRR